MINELPPKEITWKTNFNNKLQCPAFIHIDFMPQQTVPNEVLMQKNVCIKTSDGTSPAVIRKLYWLQPLQLAQVTDILSFTSHGMPANEYCKWLINEYPGQVTMQTQMAIYFYLNF